jgi:hypothetical protein
MVKIINIKIVLKIKKGKLIKGGKDRISFLNSKVV